MANLIANAIKVTPTGGAIEVGAAPAAERVVFFVRDTGPGIDPADLPRLFERYWRGTTTPYKGSGLGLSIARGIVDAHGGRIWAESQLGVGSTFYFSL
jgi:signal transduction histidine kinase